MAKIVFALPLIVLVAACSSSGSSSNDHLKDPCAAYGAHLGCSCDTEGDIACSAPTNTTSEVVECKGGTFVKASLTCPGSRLCESLDSSRVVDFSGTVSCNVSATTGDPLLFTIPGAPCAIEGHGGCSLDLRTIMRCTNSKWTTLSSCSGSQQCAFTSGANVGCI